jgi:thioredoxin reductase (NADPH)
VGVNADVTVHDVVSIGAGPAALSAAIYTTREDLDTVLVEKGVIGGLAAITDQVDNYPGFPDGVTGMSLAESLEKQAVRFGAKFEYGEVTAIENRGDKKRIVMSNGELFAKSVLIATGSDWKKLGIPGEMEFYGRGVHYCATCDGPVYRDKRLVVVGGGNSAIQEAIFLTKFASHIDILVRGDSLRASEVLQHELPEHADKITVHYNTKPLEIIGEAGKLVEKVVAETNRKKVDFACDGVFVFIGLQPTTGFLKYSLDLDELGFVKTNEDLETSMEGVFAAGDVRSGATMQIASAVGEGATAALKIREYLKDRH